MVFLLAIIKAGYGDERVMNLVEIKTDDAMITYALTVQEYSHDAVSYTHLTLPTICSV